MSSEIDGVALLIPLLLNAAFVALAFLVLLRQGGLVALMVFTFTFTSGNQLGNADWSAWHGLSTVAVFVSVAALAAYGFHAASAGRNVISSKAF